MPRKLLWCIRIYKGKDQLSLLFFHGVHPPYILLRIGACNTCCINKPAQLLQSPPDFTDVKKHRITATPNEWDGGNPAGGIGEEKLSKIIYHCQQYLLWHIPTVTAKFTCALQQAYRIVVRSKPVIGALVFLLCYKHLINSLNSIRYLGKIRAFCAAYQIKMFTCSL